MRTEVAFFFVPCSSEHDEAAVQTELDGFEVHVLVDFARAADCVRNPVDLSCIRVDHGAHQTTGAATPRP